MYSVLISFSFHTLVAGTTLAFHTLVAGTTLAVGGSSKQYKLVAWRLNNLHRTGLEAVSYHYPIKFKNCQRKLTKMRAELDSLNHCAVPFLICANANLYWYYTLYSIHYTLYSMHINSL